MSKGDLAIVPGGAGFIGSHMVDLLIDGGFKVHIIDNLTGGRAPKIAHHDENPDVSFSKCDIRDVALDDPAFEKARFVFHFAGIGDIVPSIEQPLEYMSANVQGTARMLECARAANDGKGVEKFVYAASSSCYGLAETPTSETHPIQPQYPYALSKYLGEEAVMHWHKVYGLPVNAVRIFNAYGIRSRTTGVYGAVFGVFLRQKLAENPFTVVGDGTQTRDFIYVTDVARSFLAAAETEITGESFNVGAGNPQSVNRLVELLGGDVTYIPKRPGEPDCTHADITKISTRLGWQPEISFEEGVQRVVDQIENWREAPLWDSDNIAQATGSWFKYLGKPQDS
ncbi:MAG: GDP-mannose 4,6-dehydratase [Alphaproteobacteria bacterium]